MKRLLMVLFFGLTMVFSAAAFGDEGCGCGQMGKMEHGMKGGCMMGHGGMHGGMKGGGMMGPGGMHGGMMGGGHKMGEGEMKGGGMMGDMMDDHHRMMQMIMTSLGLDEKQKEAVADIKHRVKKDLIRKKADKEVALIELKELTKKDPMDMKAVEAKLKQIGGLATDIHMTLIKAKDEVRSKLTAEQKKKLKELKEKRHMMGGMGGGMGGCMMGGGGCACACECMGAEGGCGCMEQSGGKAEQATPSTPAHKH